MHDVSQHTNKQLIFIYIDIQEYFRNRNILLLNLMSLELFCSLLVDYIVLLPKSAPDLENMLEISDSYLSSKKLVFYY